MAEKGSFLFRTNPKMLAALKRWADDEFRSTNGQLEYILHQALRDAGRLSDPEADAGARADGGPDGKPDAARKAKRKPRKTGSTR